VLDHGINSGTIVTHGVASLVCGDIIEWRFPVYIKNTDLPPALLVVE